MDWSFLKYTGTVEAVSVLLVLSLIVFWLFLTNAYESKVVSYLLM